MCVCVSGWGLGGWGGGSVSPCLCVSVVVCIWDCHPVCVYLLWCVSGTLCVSVLIFGAALIFVSFPRSGWKCHKDDQGLDGR